MGFRVDVFHYADLLNDRVIPFSTRMDLGIAGIDELRYGGSEEGKKT